MLEVRIPGLPEGSTASAIAHLSDFHLGLPSRGRVATERAVAWVAERKPRPRLHHGRPRLAPARRARSSCELLGTLEQPFVILGNHDVAVTRDPFSRAAELEGLAEVAVLLRDEAAVVEHTRRRIQLVGTDAKSYPKGASRPWELADRDADLRILLCHFPGIARKLPAGASTSSSPGTCTRARSCSRTRAAGSSSHTRARASSRASTRPGAA